MNLFDAMERIQQFENEAIEIPTDTKEFVKEKVDGYFHVLNHMDMEIERLKAFVEHYQKKMVARVNEAERLKKWLADSLDTFGWTELKGNERKLRLVTQERLVLQSQPSADVMEKFPDLVECKLTQSFKWKSDALKAAYEKDPESVKSFIDKKPIRFIRFD